MLKKVLIITYYWPPGSGPGVQRWLKFSKYLPEFGWEPIIVTVNDGSYPNKDNTLLNDVPDGIKIQRTKTIEPFTVYNLLRGKRGKSVELSAETEYSNGNAFQRFSNYVRANFFIPDARQGWNHFAFKAAKELIKSENPSVLITSGPPHSTHLVGLRLKEKYQIPWIADFRDPWTTSFSRPFLPLTKRSDELNVELESKVLQSVSALITATPSMEMELASKTSRIKTITNSYDESDFNLIKPQISKKFVMAYVGSLMSVQNTINVWTALEELCSEVEGFREDFEFQITGSASNTVLNSLYNADLKSNLSVRKYVPHKIAIRLMVSAHILFLPIPNAENNKVILTGKIFEYLATERTILGIGPADGDASKLLATCGRPEMIDYDNKLEIKARILTGYQLFLKDPAPTSEGNEAYKSFTGSNATKDLSLLLNSLVPD
jgi:hypothetical protein